MRFNGSASRSRDSETEDKAVEEFAAGGGLEIVGDGNDKGRL